MDIAACLGKRDHTTIIYNHRQCHNWLQTNDEYKLIFYHIINEFKNAYGTPSATTQTETES